MNCLKESNATYIEEHSKFSSANFEKFQLEWKYSKVKFDQKPSNDEEK